MSYYKTNFGRELNEEWGVGARHALYSEDGKWYMPLTKFPGAFFDKYGYLLFKTEKEYLNCKDIKIGKRVNVRQGISKIPGYYNTPQNLDKGIWCMIACHNP